MAMDWYYAANQQQAGPVEFATLQQMLQSGSLSGTDMVFGPGMSAWTPAGQVPALSGGGGGGPSMLGYRGAEMGNSGLSQHAMEMLRQTKPWTRFVSIMMFIGAGFMILGGVGMMAVGATMGFGRRSPVPAALGFVYLALGLLYFIPAMFLTRFSNSVGNLMRTNRTSDLELALQGQKSFWKFTGIMVIVMIIGYIVFFAVLIANKGQF